MDIQMKKLPTIALRNLTIVPKMVAHFDVSRKPSIQAVERAMVKDQRLFVVTQKDGDQAEPKLEDLYTYGTVCVIKQILKLPNKIVRVMVEGVSKGRLYNLDQSAGYLLGDVLDVEALQEEPESIYDEAMKRQLHKLFLELVAFDRKKHGELVAHLEAQKSFQSYMEQLTAHLPMEYTKLQKYLDAESMEERYQVLVSILQSEIQILSIQKDLQEKVQKKVDKKQKEFILREQQKLIQEELEENEFAPKDSAYFAKQAKELNASKEVKEHILQEISKFQSVGAMSAEGSVLRGYIETLLQMPWDNASKDNNDIENAARILEEDHYGLEKVKERVLEFLAVRALLAKQENPKADAPIICLVGPPGTGKTSIARSIARALDKKYVRICLGGVRDEAEIRGHRRTYVGAMPGRIATAIKQAGVKNPLLLLDEIDKVSSDYKGDTASALLEVLDGEQNSKFRDHYIELPLDLSQVLFIATANSTEPIPRPLLDRMEVIELSSYTANEKLHIAKQYLVAKQLEKNGLTKKQLSIHEGALKTIISDYTREAGVRGLERRIGEICRKAAMDIVKDDTAKISVNKKNVEKFLGKPLFHKDMANKKDEIGIVRGLAWTCVGGDTLQIEVNVMPGKGEILLTGQLGDVMKESAKAGISYIRSVGDRYQIPQEYFAEHDIHIHIPEGAVPKDGPSAGITMATAILSAITKTPVRCDVAMTGEITLRGRVLPIGGLKEKTLAAKDAGMKTVIVPEDNRRDVQEISEEIKEGLEFVYVDTMEKVIGAAFV